VIYLIDTDWVIDFLKGDPSAIALLRSFPPKSLAISVITYAEIYEGILASADSKQGENVFRGFLRNVSVLPLNRTIARHAAAVRVHLRRQGRSVCQRAYDLLIAATALGHDLTLVTRNVSDYRDVPDLRLY
jgi:predicted nucleic acid-binding protein